MGSASKPGQTLRSRIVHTNSTAVYADAKDTSKSTGTGTEGKGEDKGAASTGTLASMVR